MAVEKGYENVERHDVLEYEVPQYNPEKEEDYISPKKEIRLRNRKWRSMVSHTGALRNRVEYFETDVKLLMRKVWPTGKSVSNFNYNDPEPVLQYVGRSTHRSPPSNSQ